MQLTATSSEGTIHWYVDECDGVEIGVGETITVTPIETATYFARIIEGECQGNCAEQHTVEVTAVAIPTLLASPSFGALARKRVKG